MTTNHREEVEETPDEYGAFPRLSAEQIEELAPYGERRATQRGEVLIREGGTHTDFVVILDGKVAIVERYEGEERVIGVHGPGRFLGELNLLTGQPAFVSAGVGGAGGGGGWP